VHGGNVLVILSDDIGVDKHSGWGAHPDPPATPNIDRLRCAGLSFSRAWSNPTCTPSRSSLMTGRHASRTGMGRWIPADSVTWDLQPGEVTIAEMLAHSPHGYTSAVVGKWHLASFRREEPGRHPLDQGFSTHRGMLGNPAEALQPGNLPRGYWNWEISVDGQTKWMQTYLTTQTADDAIDVMAQLPEPWFLYVAFNSAHSPVHAPPPHLTTHDVTEASSEADRFDAMVEATDAEIGRVIASLSDETLADTTIIYLSDNGTPAHGITDPLDTSRGKGTVYEGGVHVPMVVVGPAVSEPGRSSDALVHFVDLFPTLAEIAEVDLSVLTRKTWQGPEVPLEPELDGHSLLANVRDPDAPGSRDLVFTEGFRPSGGGPYDWRRRTLRDETWKYTWIEEDGLAWEGLYRLDPFAWDEGENLVLRQRESEEQAALERLRAAMAATDERLEFAW
jgi:arylsulfatase A-like enzyme